MSLDRTASFIILTHYNAARTDRNHVQAVLSGNGLFVLLKRDDAGQGDQKSTGNRVSIRARPSYTVITTWAYARLNGS